jgi:hypothetical protein
MSFAYGKGTLRNLPEVRLHRRDFWRVTAMSSSHFIPSAYQLSLEGRGLPVRRGPVVLGRHATVKPKQPLGWLLVIWYSRMSMRVTEFPWSRSA